MRCAQLRTALSARLDGEPTGLAGTRLDKHLARCTGCRDWLERGERLRAQVSAVALDGPSEAWAAELLARLGVDSPVGRAPEGPQTAER
ncbi:zf-HC2 domain-containing protein [Kitasatospora sp. NPDC017646]|uniref:zf-HC2 domain-containing protein n=1 Tax=Kitasatospora sp. NPDC017646 TaxID=3364024 RepID=UPI00378D785D